MPHKIYLMILAVVVAILAALGGCDRRPGGREKVIRVWSHQGQEAENLAMRRIAATFNAAHAAQRLRVELIFFPDFQYTEKVAIAAAARDLPDAFDIDGPLVARFVDGGLLAPLEPYFDAATLKDFLPTIIQQGTIDGHLYALGAFDSATVLYYDRQMLSSAGVQPPPNGEGWTWEQFLAACAALKTAGIEPLSMHMNESADEWYTYAFSPVVWSGGGRLIAEDSATVSGILASDANIRSIAQWQQVFVRGFASTDPVDPDPFGSGTVAMDWSGHWMARSHLEKKGERLGAMPLPRIRTPAAPCGSWCWGISAATSDPQAAAEWVRWVTDPVHGIEPIVRANGAVPARRSAFALFPEYSKPPYALFREQLEHNARPRPRTPFYATLTSRFAAALRDIARGADAAARLKQAEDEVQRVIDRKQGATRARD
jgi:ABC-type glycerol-3-phosphate transport system substrate-binding protein